MRAALASIRSTHSTPSVTIGPTDKLDNCSKTCSGVILERSCRSISNSSMYARSRSETRRFKPLWAYRLRPATSFTANKITSLAGISTVGSGQYLSTQMRALESDLAVG